MFGSGQLDFVPKILAQLDTATGVRRAGVEAEWLLLEGWMPGALLEKAREIKPDLLVPGTHGVYRGLEHMLIGSNAEAMLLSTRLSDTDGGAPRSPE